MQRMASRSLSPSSQLSLRELQQQQQQQQMTNPPQIPIHQSSSHLNHQSTQDDFLEQMLSNLPASWADLSGNPKSLWDHHINPNNNPNHNPQNPNNDPSSTATNSNSSDQKLFKAGEEQQQYPYEESTLLASRLRQHQISGNSPKPMMLQQQLLLSRGAGAPTSAPDASSFGAADSGFFSLSPRLGISDVSDSYLPDNSVQGLFNSLTGSILPRNDQTTNQQHFHHPQTPNFSAIANRISQLVVAGTTGESSTITAPIKQKVRARRGQATDPHSIAERLRRERISERMKVLQELVPNANKTDKATMLDEIIDYVKFLQLQVKVLSMSRLGGAGGVAPLVADISAEGGGGGCIQGTGGANSDTNGAPTSDNSLTVMENQVVKLMEEDMGSAMQYLQGKGLCLMPISFASAISTGTTCQSRNPSHPLDGPASPNLPAVTVHSTTLANGSVHASVKDAKSC